MEDQGRRSWKLDILKLLLGTYESRTHCLLNHTVGSWPQDRLSSTLAELAELKQTVTGYHKKVIYTLNNN